MTQPERRALNQVESEKPNPGSPEEFEALLRYLKHGRGFDFTAYKRSGLMRRVLVRMQSVGLARFNEYQDYLQVDPEEFTRLFNTILINVTSFFRDDTAWEYLAEQVLPTLLGANGAAHSIRVWSAGCASGEEAYSVAMLLAEQLGEVRFRERVKIYATDVDAEALNQARLATYSEREVDGVPPNLLRKYFDKVDNRFVFNKELRRSVILGRHDLIQDAPISRVDLLICRNCLMYFNAEAQALILARFHFALASGGVLFLGKAETLLSNISSFGAVDPKRRLFTKAAGTVADRPPLFDPVRSVATDDADHSRLRNGAVDASPLAHMLVDTNGTLIQISQQLRSIFGLTQRDVGRRLQDLEISYRPFELRSCIERACSERRPVVMREGSWTTPGGEALSLELQVVPVPDGNSGFAGVAIFYQNVTRQRLLQEEVRRANQELETAMEELQSTNEELETTNEELQSTVEELETTNEELQSTNEEMEAMNEELQSTNEELQALNEEARERSDQLGQLNAFLEAILTSLRSAVVVVDGDLRVHKWNYMAEELWGIRAAEVAGKNFLNLDSGLPAERLKAPIRACLVEDAKHVEVILDATNRRGKPIRVKVTCTPLAGPRGASVGGVIMVMEDTDAKA
jgi:two-component system, chemotaxis family, CheB/CheR fusion protein